MCALNKLESFEPARKVGSLFDEFKAFAFKGNVIDLAVGVVIGTTFGAIVNSLVKDIIMPLISVITPGTESYQSWVWEIQGKTIPYGKFLAEVLNFIIVAFVLFLFIKKLLGWLMRSRRESLPPPLTKDQELLTEIRDLLRSQGRAPGIAS